MSEPEASDIQLVVLDCPIDVWTNPVTQELFHQIVSLKMEGYGAGYPRGVLPLDASDFVGTHLCACRRHPDGSLELLAGYKSIALERCREFRLPFPALTTLKSSGADRDVPAIERILSECDERKTRISYDSSWTKATGKRTEGLSKILKDLVTTFSVYYHRDYGIPRWITCGVLRYRTDVYFEQMGHEPVSGVFPQYSLFEEKVRMYHLSTYSPAALETASRYSGLWDRHLLVSSQGQREKAAA